MTNASPARITNYDAFFDFYLMEHRSPHSRALHFFGTGVGSLVAIAAVATGHYAFIPLALLLGYGPAWIGHFFFERNKPATFQYPWWSFISDYRMLGLWLTGRLDRALQDAARRRNVAL